MVDGWTLLQQTLVSLVVSVLSAAVSALVAEAAVRQGWAYQVEPTEARGWMGRTEGTRPGDRSGINAAAVVMVTMFLALSVGMLLAGAVFGW